MQPRQPIPLTVVGTALSGLPRGLGRLRSGGLRQTLAARARWQARPRVRTNCAPCYGFSASRLRGAVRLHLGKGSTLYHGCVCAWSNEPGPSQAGVKAQPTCAGTLAAPTPIGNRHAASPIGIAISSTRSATPNLIFLWGLERSRSDPKSLAALRVITRPRLT